ncbi:MAG: hypothetical protein GC154_08525 [bacterium]|nr:hypothetical protein [bacterium]
MDFHQLKRASIFDRKSLVRRDRAPAPPAAPASFLDFFHSLPGYLKADDLRGLTERMLAAKRAGKPILMMMGAHSIKVGLSGWIIRALREGYVTALAMNGACIVHDFEMALAGQTSEDVAESLQDGSFGMTLETGKTINEWIVEAAAGDRGLGEFLGERLAKSGYAFASNSILAAAHQAGVPVTVHVALGTDVLHHHPEASGEAIGKTSLTDFKRLCEIVSQLGDGGVALNVGSNVILPEVFLKALTTARNLCGEIDRFTTANFDMIQHYRPNTNVVRRPTQGGGTGYSFTGHHEIMLPLLFTALAETDAASGA